ncbi:caspase domain-containing protein [Agromyces ramosus]|uniref:Caspase domain-containing protein n=1 Tax=Agromyces ramosus TaxID=33879 RepID=A0A4Q7ME91_9MICO|nr:caspase family protein [Agromyces ramosus]RZS65713.1 caspase domain-containing protein [Agromyces ramosus]
MTGIRPPSPAPEVRTAAPRGGGHAFTKDELAALRPHVILLDDGGLSSTAVDEPRSVEEFTTTDADVAAIFETHLPAFVAEHAPGPVPIVIYAHGGLVDKQSGFEIARQQVDWWKENGVYPIHFVWQTAFGTALWDALRRWTTGGRRGWLDEAKDGFLETAARLLGGGGIWNDMKVDAAAASVDGGGGARFAAALGAWIAAHPDEVTVHAVGHSAGSIFHSHFIPRALGQERHPIPSFETVSFLAPAVRVDTFNAKLLGPARSGGIGRLAVFDMDDDTERDDNCAHIYNKSLLYLVSASFEPQKSTPILGLEKHLTTDAALGPFFTSPQRRADLVLAPLDTGARSTSTATSHGGFDDDAPTMESVAKRVSGRATVTRFPAGERGREVHPWSAVGDAAAPAPAPASGSREAGSPGGVRRALCIGIDRYVDEGDRLQGCVADAKAWAAAFREQGFDVTELIDGDATRDGILRAILDLVSESAPGDVLAVQYSGHGTFVPDLDADEDDGDVASDEALCPVDFRGTGRLVIDDDLARIWDVIPDGVSLTAFFDSCHSGSANRAPTPLPQRTAGSRPRLAPLTDRDRTAYRADRGASEPGGASELRQAAMKAVLASETPPVAVPRSAGVRREVLVSACKATEVAWESNGQGDFTRAALPLLTSGVGTVSNRAFVRSVVEILGPGRRQTPEYHGDDSLGARPLLTPSTAAPIGETGPAGDGKAPAPLDDDRRTAAVVAILRATADLLET